MSIWEEDPTYPMEDWRYDVSHGDTLLGYWEWVEHQKETARDDYHHSSHMEPDIDDDPNHHAIPDDEGGGGYGTPGYNQAAGYRD